MINKVILLGNVGQEAEVRHLESTSVAKFTLATNESYKDKQGEWQTKTEWHNITVWGNTAEYAERNIKKGMQIYVEGKIQTDKYQDKDGVNRYSTKIVAKTLRILGKKDHTDELASVDANSVAAKPEVRQMPAEGTDGLTF